MIKRLMAAMHAFSAPPETKVEQFDRLIGAGTERKDNPVGNLIVPFYSGQEIAAPEGYEQLSLDGFKMCATARAIIGRIARRTAQLPIKLQRHNTEGEWEDLDATEDDEHPLMTLLRRPNKAMTRVDLLESVFASRLLAGESFLLPFGPLESGPPTELWWARPDKFHCEPGDDGLVKTWTYKTGKGETPFDMDVSEGTLAPVFFWKTFNPVDQWRGLSVLGSGRMQIMQTNGASKWNANLIANGMRPPGAFVYAPDSTGSPLGRAGRAQIEDEIRRKLTGPQGAGSPLILEGGLTWQDMSVASKDLDWLAGQQYADRTLCFLLGYPPIMLGIPGDATYKNYSEARTSFYQDTAIPLMTEFLEHMNEWLVPQYGDDLRLVVDEDKIDALTEKRNEMWDRVEKSTILTINEKREMVGKDPIENPLADELWMPTSLAPIDEAGAPEETGEIDPETGEPVEPELDEDGEPIPGEKPKPGKKPAFGKKPAAKPAFGKKSVHDETFRSKLTRLMGLAGKLGKIAETKWTDPNTGEDDHGRGDDSGSSRDPAKLQSKIASTSKAIKDKWKDKPISMARDGALSMAATLDRWAAKDVTEGDVDRVVSMLAEARKIAKL